jgi:hypothetical protein
MKQQHQQSITTLPPSPDADRHGRMLKYGIMMGIRVICLVVVFLVPGWWKVAPGIGAVLLPYFAVVVANVGSGRSEAEVQRPGHVLPYSASGLYTGGGDEADEGPRSGRPAPEDAPSTGDAETTASESPADHGASG